MQSRSRSVNESQNTCGLGAFRDLRTRTMGVMEFEQRTRSRGRHSTNEDRSRRLCNDLKRYSPKKRIEEDGGQGKDEEHEEELGRHEDDDDEGDEEESGTEDCISGFNKYNVLKWMMVDLRDVLKK
ncbi:hypothetical protein HYC85_032205 [Camellia sinensis]|uniref:Uncharacterized protein n=1 Tax=Camellia sinensis TaxID=4442 RepID=A0A7J7FSN7_CAMSI|nr:hypothetical protein HYC85_032205 [Camellia sinensis]